MKVSGSSVSSRGEGGEWVLMAEGDFGGCQDELILKARLRNESEDDDDDKEDEEEGVLGGERKGKWGLRGFVEGVVKVGFAEVEAIVGG